MVDGWMATRWWLDGWPQDGGWMDGHKMVSGGCKLQFLSPGLQGRQASCELSVQSTLCRHLKESSGKL